MVTLGGLPASNAEKFSPEASQEESPLFSRKNELDGNP